MQELHIFYIFIVFLLILGLFAEGGHPLTSEGGAKVQAEGAKDPCGAPEAEMSFFFRKTTFV